ncbi:hypothetical protein Q73A0000_05010 [Kaistella flava (ex Peng et al. 2021)]|uniref:Uncharacterized protein n=1 Tax=Kaistella flava (ex Peng et al. 2021) TaxID=2038776 RepID=A0A7M2Y6I8_9FLAO|nr:hypothetical protein [Kaistella flava (ex Peng et al. 2021)]QOW09771.1 hypothetical protein Q73A0000_05010 [Kaistella flava (ex Peng et al. 2021)]
MENTATATHEFDFDINKIDIIDLKKLYTHFEIENFGDADADSDTILDHQSFFKLYEDTDAFLLIRIAALFSSNSVKIIETEYYKRDSKTETVFVDEVHENANHIFELDAADYHHFDAAFFNFANVLQMYGVEEAAPILEKYSFLKKL